MENIVNIFKFDNANDLLVGMPSAVINLEWGWLVAKDYLNLVCVYSLWGSPEHVSLLFLVTATFCYKLFF